MNKKRISPRLAFIAYLAAGLLFVSCANADRSSSEQLVVVGSHRLETYLEGKGEPAVVIDSGISDTLDKLRPLQERLARVTRVVTYNRAGYGRSEPGPVPRHAGREAEELKTLLETASVTGPYILVGHSLGALNMMAFASKYPDDTAGLVLLDPPPLSFILGQAYQDLGTMAERMTAEWQAVADSAAKSADAREKAKSDFFRMIASEHREMFGESAKTVGAISTFGNIPLAVLAAGKANPAFGAGAGEYQQYWIEQSRLLAGMSTKGKFVLAEGSSHYLYVDVPDIVAREILSVVDEVRARMPDAKTKESYLECLEAVGRTIGDRYFDPDFGGLDWKEVQSRYRPLIAAAASDKAFYERINKMVFELNVSHIGVVPPDEKEQLEPIASAEGSLGVSLRLLDGAAVVTSVETGSPGEEMGLRPGFIVESIGGKTIAALAAEVELIPPLHERNERKRVTGKVLEQLYGKPDTPVFLVYRDAAGKAHEARGKMRPREGKIDLPGQQMPPFYVEFETRRLEDIGYIRFNAFLPPVAERFAEAVASFRDARGLIIDLRGNHGGVFPVRKPVVDQLVPERRLFWSYKGRRATRDVYAEPATNVYSGPLVVLADVMSASSAEEVTGGLQSIGRAFVIGERTAGICLVMDAVTLPNGALFAFPVEQTRTADGTVLEGRGVIPDLEVGLDRARLLQGVDSQLEAAIKHLKAKSIIAKCAEAMGGAAGIEAVRTLRLEVVYPDHDASAILHEIRRPNQIRTERPGKYIAAFDGKLGAMLKYDPAKPGQPPIPQDLPAEAARGFETDLVWFFPAFFDYPAEYAGIVESNGTKCHRLVAALPLGTRAEYLIDTRTYLVKRIAVDESFQGQTFHIEREWLDFKSVQGILYPSRMTYPGRSGKTATAEIRKAEFNPVKEDGSLKEVGRLDFGPAYDVVVVHKTAYVTGNRGVHIIDVENPASPRELGRLKLKDGAFGLSVNGQRAYIAGDSEGFFIADIADPKNPVVIGQYSPKEGITQDVSIDGTFAYVIKREGRLLVLDITNENKPLLLGELPVGSAGREAVHQEDRLYLADSSWGLVLYNVSDPSSPRRLSVVPGTEGASGIAFKKSLMFLGCHGFGLKILDVSAAAIPQVKGTFRLSREANDVLVDNDDLYVADQNDGIIHVLDIQNPSLPVIVTSRKGYMPHRLFHDGDYLYAADGKFGLVIFQYDR